MPSAYKFDDPEEPSQIVYLTLCGSVLPRSAQARRLTVRVHGELEERGPLMSVYVGIDLHHKRSQVAVVESDGRESRRRTGSTRCSPTMDSIGRRVCGAARDGPGWLSCGCGSRRG
jgi:hypothetical protein